MTAGPITLTVNGEACHPRAPAGQSLLGYLRGELGLTGAKIGCATGDCGACTVIVDDVAVQACQMPLSSADGREVQTVEELVRVGMGARVADALIEAEAAQCGYCLPGILAAAVAAIQRDGIDTDLEAALSRNICRCGTHHRILTALRRLRDAMAAPAP